MSKEIIYTIPITDVTDMLDLPGARSIRYCINKNGKFNHVISQVLDDDEEYCCFIGTSDNLPFRLRSIFNKYAENNNIKTRL